MSKRVRSLLFAGIAVVALVGLLLVLIFVLPEKKAEETPEDPVDTTVTLVTKADTVTVETATVTCDGKAYTVKKNESGDYIIEDFDGLPHSSALNTLCEELLLIVADRLIEEQPADASVFGFTDTVKNGVSVTYSDGDTFAFECGDVSPTGEGRYLRQCGKDAVYLIDAATAESFFKEATYYLSCAPVIAPDAENEGDTVVVRNVELSGTVRKQKIYFRSVIGQKDENGNATTFSGYQIERPFVRQVSTDSSMIDVSAFTGTAASRVELVRPTAENLKRYGLNNPYSRCDVDLAVQKGTTVTDEKTGEETTTYSFYNIFRYTICLGDKNEEGLRYGVVYSEGKLIPILYLFDESNVSWASLQYDDIADTALFHTYITTVSQLSLDDGNTATAFALSHHPGAETTDGELTVTANGKTYDTGKFRDLYQQLMLIKRTGSADAAPTGTPALTVGITTAKKTTVIKLYRYSAGKYTVVQPDGECYLTDAKLVENFITAYRDFI